MEDLLRREDARPGGGELKCKREVVERAAELVHGFVGLRPRPSAEELDRIRFGKRQDRVLDLSSDPQELPARDEELQVGAGLDERGELGCRTDHLLEVVEEKQKLALPDVVGQVVELDELVLVEVEVDVVEVVANP